MRNEEYTRPSAVIMGNTSDACCKRVLVGKIIARATAHPDKRNAKRQTEKRAKFDDRRPFLQLLSGESSAGD
jgi:hypothetical protein